MTTTTPEPQGSDEIPWWERLTDASGDSEASRGVLRMVIIAAVVGAVGILGYVFFQGNQEEQANELSAALESAQSALPIAVSDPFNPSPAVYARQQTAGVLFGYSQKAGAEFPRGLTTAGLDDADEAAAYQKKAEGEIANLEDKKSDFEGSDQEYMYWNTLQALHFYAARNAPKLEDVKRHLDEQKKTLDAIESKFGGHPFFSMRPNTDQPDKNIIALWREAGDKELAFREQMSSKAEVTADKGLTATITLDDGKTVTLEFFSLVAPKSVASFLANARGGFYDGSAVSRVDKEANLLTLGNPFSKMTPDRPFLWDRTQELYSVPVERNLLLPVTKGSVTLRPVGSSANGFEFDIYFDDPEQDVVAPVFARVTGGLDDLRTYLESEVHDFEQLANQVLPKTRIGVKSVVVNGQAEHKGLDASWSPTPELPEEAPEATDAEKAFVESLNANDAKPADEAPTDEGEGKNDG